MRRVFYKEKVIPLSRMGKRFWIPPSMMEKVVGHHCMEYELIDPLKNLRSTLISNLRCYTKHATINIKSNRQVYAIIGDQNCHSLDYRVEASSCFYKKVHQVKLKYGSNRLAKLGQKMNRVTSLLRLLPNIFRIVDSFQDIDVDPEFMAYHASSKANQNSKKNHEIHFGKSYSIENYQGRPELQPYYQNEAERGSNLDKLLMQFKEKTKSTQQALQSVEIQVGELAEAVTQYMSRQEKYFVEVEAQEESPVKEHESREKDEEQAQQQGVKYSTVENQ
ncbi:hypothetical protein JHK86_052577 [Glycine max]|nr:hypothetical protein JHK86_052577 [Glycine max]